MRHDLGWRGTPAPLGGIVASAALRALVLCFPRMIIVCPSCQARYKFDESKLGTRPRARTKCAKCGGSIDIENPLLAAMTLPPGSMAPPPPPDPTPTPPAPAAGPDHDTAPRASPGTGRGRAQPPDREQG